MSLPRFFSRFRSSRNSAPGRGVNGGGGVGGGSGSSGLGFRLATSDTQILEHLVHAGVVGHAPAGLGVLEGLAGGRVGDPRLER